ncbi:MAG: hypothetical protein WBL50_19495, partial [Candidatus Acidiferrum sp.]
THTLASKERLDRCVHVFTPYARICVASSFRCCPPTISSVIADNGQGLAIGEALRIADGTPAWPVP